MLEILVLSINATDARHRYLALVDQLREHGINYRQNFNQLTLTTEHTRTRFIFLKKHIKELKNKTDIVCGHDPNIVEKYPDVTFTNHEPIYYIKQKELDEWNTI